MALDPVLMRADSVLETKLIPVNELFKLLDECEDAIWTTIVKEYTNVNGNVMC